MALVAAGALGSDAAATQIRGKLVNFRREGYAADGSVADPKLVQSGFGWRDRKLLLNDEMGLERMNKVAKVRDDILDTPAKAKILRKSISETKQILRNSAFDFAQNYQAMLFEVALYDLPTSTKMAAEIGNYLIASIEDSLVDLAELVDDKIPATSVQKDALLLNEKLKDVEEGPGVKQPKAKKGRAPRSYTQG